MLSHITGRKDKKTRGNGDRVHVCDPSVDTCNGGWVGHILRVSVPDEHKRPRLVKRALKHIYDNTAEGDILSLGHPEISQKLPGKHCRIWQHTESGGVRKCRPSKINANSSSASTSLSGTTAAEWRYRSAAHWTMSALMPTTLDCAQLR